MNNLEVIVVADDVRCTTMRAFAAARGWRRTGQTDRAHLVMASEQWTPEAGLTVTWVEDHTSRTKMVRIAGRPGPVLVIAERVRQALPHTPRGALLERAQLSADPAELIGLLGKLSHCRPDHPDPKHFGVVARLLAHESIAVRRAAIRCGYRYPWPQLQSVVHARSEVDPRLAPQLRRLGRYLDAQPNGRA